MGNKAPEVILSEAEYYRLLGRDRLLCCLEAAGVGNWCGIDLAYEILEDEESVNE